MKIPTSKLARTLAERMLRDGTSKELSGEIAAYLLEQGRTKDLNSLIRDIQQYWADAGHVDVITTSAFPLTSEVRTDISDEIRRVYPKAKNITLTEQRDGALIGGARVELANQQLDVSIQTKLNKFKQLTTAGKAV